LIYATPAGRGRTAQERSRHGPEHRQHGKHAKRKGLAQAGGHASDFIKGIGDKLVAAVNGPGSERDKRVRLTQIIDSGVDADGVARFCLGRFWRNAAPEQQKRHMELFHQVRVNNITSKLGDYRTHRSGTGLWRSDGYELLRQGLFQPRHCQIEERSHFNRQKPVGGVDEVNWHRRWMKFI